jgi:hypothetical protein
MPSSPIPIKEILKDPSAIYPTPQDVMSDHYITDDTKEEILRCWEEDVTALLRAESENMGSGEPSAKSADLLTEISKLREELGLEKMDSNDI